MRNKASVLIDDVIYIMVRVMQQFVQEVWHEVAYFYINLYYFHIVM